MPAVNRNGDWAEEKAFRTGSGKNETPAGDFTVLFGITGSGDNAHWHILAGGGYVRYATYFVSSDEKPQKDLFHSVSYAFSGIKSDMNVTDYQALLNGTPASKPGITLCARDAKWIYENCEELTPVRVVDEKSGVLPTEDYPALNAKRKSAYADRDPTDPDENNPYRR